MRIILTISLILLGVAAMPQPAAAELGGSWRGSGVVQYRGGADKLRCRVHFSRVSAKAFGVSSDCATETGRYATSGRVVASGTNRYFGLVQGEGVTGKVVITQRGNRLSVSVTSRRGSAKLSLSRH
jgi:hypothetical protein